MGVNEKMTAIADAIRQKTGKTGLLTLDSMPGEIQGITGGGEVSNDDLTITGDCSYMFASPNWKWYLDRFGSRIETENLKTTWNMFLGNTVEEITFDFNFSGTQNEIKSMFAYCDKLKDVSGAIKGAQITTMSEMFNSCVNLRYLPEFIDCDFDYIRRISSLQGYNGAFKSCNSLRCISPVLLKEMYSDVTTAHKSGTYLFSAFDGLWALDELVGINPTNSNSTTNMFSTFCNMASRCKDITFLESDLQTHWVDQTINLTRYVGWALEKGNILNYNSGLTEATQITDDESYQRLKNSVDSWTLLKEYSRYNRESAVRTINSLPDVSTGSGNVIKFDGKAGSKTDGGAINTMTEEEIAVAISKGFTVSFA